VGMGTTMGYWVGSGGNRLFLSGNTITITTIIIIDTVDGGVAWGQMVPAMLFAKSERMKTPPPLVPRRQ